VPTDSGAFRSQFCGREIVNAVLIVGGVAFEKAAHTTSHSARIICGNPQRYGKPLKQRGCLPRSSGHSSRVREMQEIYGLDLG
jgi:hypothetical protein